jgi:hypothetical protein
MEFGKGGIRIMMWSQMHGNESTTTKAIFDFVNFALLNRSYVNEFSFCIIPILNPDGAEAYTRLNANEVDLNRDAQNKSQPETQVLFQVFDEFKPDYCLNLHGQRSIFSAGEMGLPATLSFLAPAQDTERSLSNNRRRAMNLIGGIFGDLQGELAGRIGLYDDAFNLNCTGDTFQSLGVPTILFEAGHYPNDYEREYTRYCVFNALLSVFDHCRKEHSDDISIYQTIPLNAKSYLDVIIRDVVLNSGERTDIGILFEERLVENSIKFVPKVEKLMGLRNYLGHREIDGAGQKIVFSHKKTIQVGDEIDFVIIKNEKILIKT